jgi:hypothetical protein
MVISEGRKALFLEREKAEAYASTRGDALIYTLVRSTLLVSAIDRLVAAQEELRFERGTIVHVEDNTELIKSLRAEVAALKAAA